MKKKKKAIKQSLLNKLFQKWINTLQGDKRHKAIVKKRGLEQFNRWIKSPFLAVLFLKEQLRYGHFPPTLDKNMFLAESSLERRMYYELRQMYKREDIIPQYPIDRRFADFALPRYMLMIELDGSAYHQEKQKDQIRDSYIKKQGWTILRFPDWVIEKRLGEALGKISNHTAKFRESQTENNAL